LRGGQAFFDLLKKRERGEGGAEEDKKDGDGEGIIL